jgi:hypothetical protein
MAVEVTRPSTEVMAFVMFVHQILFMIVKLKTLGMLIRPQVLHLCLSMVRTVAVTISMTRGDGRQESNNPARG